MIQYELKTYLRKTSKTHSAKMYFDTKEEAQRFCSANRVRNYIIKEVEVTHKFGIQMTSWTYGNYYYKSF